MFLVILGVLPALLHHVDAAVDYVALHKSSMRKSSTSQSQENSHWELSPDIINTADAYSSSGTNDYFNDEYMTYISHDIPYYKHTVTSCDMSYLENRPHKSSELVTIKIEEGDIINFGDDIGFACHYSGPQGSSSDECACVKFSDDLYTFYAGSCMNSGWGQGVGSELPICDGDGAGYWPPGPACPADQDGVEFSVPLTPRPNNEDDNTLRCYLPMGMQGMFVHGVQFYGWADGQDYKGDGYWHNIALEFEYYDFDICYGHGTNLGEYHHHTFSPCLAELLGDQGLTHSPVYGFARDGYPIYGPWQDSTQLAQSCWKKRNYDGNSTAAGGWGCMASSSDTTNKGKRTCVLDNPWDPTATTALISSYTGPSTSATVVSQSGNGYTAESGSYWEDYYYDSECGGSGGVYLNQYNGHTHGNLGFHYHLTVDSDGLPQFPFGIGPQFYGVLSAGHEDYCCTTVENAGTGTCTGANSNYDNQVNGNSDASNSAIGSGFETTAVYNNYENHVNPFCSSISTDVEVTLSGFTSNTLTSLQLNAISNAVADVTGVSESDVTITDYTASALDRRLTTRDVKRMLTSSWSIDFIINISANYAFLTLYTGAAASATSTSDLENAIVDAFSSAIAGSDFINAINAECNATCNLPTLTVIVDDDDTGDSEKKFNPMVLIAIIAIIPIGLAFYCFCGNSKAEVKAVEMARSSLSANNTAGNGEQHQHHSQQQHHRRQK